MGKRRLGYPAEVPVKFSLTADGVGAMYASYGVLTGQELIDVDARIHEEVKRRPRYVVARTLGFEHAPDGAPYRSGPSAW